MGLVETLSPCKHEHNRQEVLSFLRAVNDMHFRRSKMSSARRFGRAPLIFTCAFLHHGRAISKYVHARAKHARTLFTNVHTSPSFHLLHHKCLHSSHKRQGSALWTFVPCTCNSILFLLQLAYHVDARKGRRNLLKFYIHNREYYLFMLEIKPSHAHTPHFLSILDASSIARINAVFVPCPYCRACCQKIAGRRK